jgi:hypothetical protein
MTRLATDPTAVSSLRPKPEGGAAASGTTGTDSSPSGTSGTDGSGSGDTPGSDVDWGTTPSS